MIGDYSAFEVELGMLYAGKKSGVNCKPDGLPCDYEQSNIKDQHRKREGRRAREGGRERQPISDAIIRQM